VSSGNLFSGPYTVHHIVWGSNTGCGL
jgi:hypothetical protein